MTIKEIIEENKTENIEVYVWNSYGKHVYANPDSYPHYDYYHCAGALVSGSLEIEEDRISFFDGSYLDIDTEISVLDYFVLNQQEYYDYDQGINKDWDVEDEPLSTLIITVEEDCIKNG